MEQIKETVNRGRAEDCWPRGWSVRWWGGYVSGMPSETVAKACAAVADLLAACEYLVAMADAQAVGTCGHCGGLIFGNHHGRRVDMERAVELARDAIAKARGGA